VLATAARVYDENISGNNYNFVAKSPLNTTNVMRILLPEAFQSIEVNNAAGQKMEFNSEWDPESNTCFLSFENSPDGVHVNLNW